MICLRDILNVLYSGHGYVKYVGGAGEARPGVGEHLPAPTVLPQNHPGPTVLQYSVPGDMGRRGGGGYRVCVSWL